MSYFGYDSQSFNCVLQCICIIRKLLKEHAKDLNFICDLGFNEVRKILAKFFKDPFKNAFHLGVLVFFPSLITQVNKLIFCSLQMLLIRHLLICRHSRIFSLEHHLYFLSFLEYRFLRFGLS